MPSGGKNNRVINLGDSGGGDSDVTAANVGVNLFTSNDNVTVTPTTAVITDFVDALLTSAPLIAPDVDYDNLFSPDAVTGIITYLGLTPRGFRISISGRVTSTSTGNDDKVFIRAIKGQGGTFVPFTGGSKRYSAGKATGQLTSEVGFSLEVFGRFEVGDQLKIQLSKDFIGDITLKEVICVFSPVVAGIL